MPASAWAIQARLGWSASNGAAGYKIYVRAPLSLFGAGLDVGRQDPGADGVVRVVVGNAIVGSLFAVTSYDGSGVESAFSNEVALPALPIGLPAATATPIATANPTVTASRTSTPQRTATSQPTATPQPTLTPQPTATSQPTVTAQRTTTPQGTATSQPTLTAQLTATPQPTATLQPTLTAQRTATPQPTATSQPTLTGRTTSTPQPTVTPTPRSTATSQPQATVLPTVTQPPPDPTPSATASPAGPDDPLVDLSRFGRIVARVMAPTGGGNHNPEVIRDGDWPPPGSTDSRRQYDTFDGPNAASEDWIGYAYDSPQHFRAVVFQEGRHFWDGGWFETLTAQVQQNGQWVDVDALEIAPSYPGVNALSYETFTLTFTPVEGDAIRIYGRPGGSAAFISVGELRVIGDNRTVLPGSSPTLTDATTTGTIIARVPVATGGGNHDLEVIRDGDLPPVGNQDSSRQYDSFDGPNAATEDWIGYEYAAPHVFGEVLFQEGKQFWDGGWFETLTVQVRQNGTWTEVGGLTATPAYSGPNGVTYERFRFDFDATAGDAIRIYGRPGGTADFISVGELRVYTVDAAQVDAPAPVETPTLAIAAIDGATPAGADGGVPTTPYLDSSTPSDSSQTPDPSQTPGEPAPIQTGSPARCGDGVRADPEACDDTDDAQCPGRCHSDCTCGIVVELPLTGWAATGANASTTLSQDPGAGTSMLDVITGVALPTDPADAADATGGAVFGDDQSLALDLPQLAFTARAQEPFQVEVVTRAADGTEYVLAYRAAGRGADQDAPAFSADGTQATFDIGAAMAGGEIGTTYRDLADDLDAAFGAPFASVAQVRVRGTLQLFRVALASDRARDEDTDALLLLPLTGWDRRGNGDVFEDVYDVTLPGLTMQADPRDRPASVIQLTYPPSDGANLLPFGTVSFAVRDADPLTVVVRALTSAGDTVELTYELGLDAPAVQLSRADLPLVAAPRLGSPFSDVRLDVIGDVARLDPDKVLAGIKSLSLRGAFVAGDIELRDPVETPAAP